MDKTKIAVGVFNKHADLYQSKFMDVSMYADSLNLFCNSIIKQNASILELACGPGNITAYLLNKRPDFKILGTDLAPNMIARAKVNNPDAEFKIMDCKDVGSFKQNYDANMCSFFLPYLSVEETAKLFMDCYLRLTSNGIIYISTMDGEYSNSGLQNGSTGEEIYMHYYLSENLHEMLREVGFKIINLQQVKSTMTNGTETVDLIISAKR